MDAKNLFDNFFVPSMGGLNLGFSVEEQRLAETVPSIAFKEIGKRPKALDTDADSESKPDAEKIELSKKNLRRIFELLEKTSDAREEFLENFPDWGVLRKDAIEKLTEIEQTIQNEKFWCNIGKIAGGLIGGAGALAIGSVLLFPPAAPVAALPAFLSGIASFAPTFLLPAAPAVAPLAVNGGIAAGVGGVSSLGVKLTEITLLRRRMEEAKKVLQGDKRAFVYMENWFKHTKELIDAVEDVIGFDAIKQLHKDMDALFVGIKELNDLKNKTPRWLEAVVRFCIRQMLTNSDKYLGDGLSAVIVTFIFVVIFLSRRNRFIFKCIVKTQQLMSKLYIDIDTVNELARVLAAVGVGGSSAIEYLPVEVARELSLGVFAGLGLAINVTNIVLTSIDLKNGSTCKQREEIKKAVEKLQEELELLENVYNTMNRSGTPNISLSHNPPEKLLEELELLGSFDPEDMAEAEKISFVSEAQSSEEI